MQFPCKHLPVLTLAVFSSYAFAANIDAPGVPNFHQVNERVYRGAQPNDQGWASLAKLGVKTIVDLRRPDEHSTDAEAKAVASAGMRYINIPMQGVVAPAEASIAKALALMNSEADGPVFVHCKRGADRTGAVIAVYRMAHDHWGNNQAVHEAKSLGMRWTQVGLKHYISTYRAPQAVAAVSADAKPAAVTP
jgi:tyrosine-protein phosphatase SIW14